MVIETAAAIPDCHIEDEDRQAYKAALEVISSLQGLKQIFLLGDYADFYGVMMHRKHPAKAFTLIKDEIEVVNARLDQLDREFPGVDKIYLFGNHEWRLMNYISDKAPHLYGLFSLPSLFKLDTRKNWTYVPYGPYQYHRILNLNYAARHKPIGNSENSILTIRKALCSVLHGHTHRPSSAHAVSLFGDTFITKCPGWLGNKDAESVQYLENPGQWGQGIEVITKDSKKDPNRFFSDTVRIRDGVANFCGRIFRA